MLVYQEGKSPLDHIFLKPTAGTVMPMAVRRFTERIISSAVLASKPAPHLFVLEIIVETTRKG